MTPWIKITLISKRHNRHIINLAGVKKKLDFTNKYEINRHNRKQTGNDATRRDLIKIRKADVAKDIVDKEENWLFTDQFVYD